MLNILSQKVLNDCKDFAILHMFASSIILQVTSLWERVIPQEINEGIVGAFAGLFQYTQ